MTVYDYIYIPVVLHVKSSVICVFAANKLSADFELFDVELFPSSRFIIINGKLISMKNVNYIHKNKCFKL